MPSGIKKGLNTKKFDRCVTKVKSKSGKKVNPYAICNASMSAKTKDRKKNNLATVFLNAIVKFYFSSLCQ
jgi:hypothetical protein